jgi:hypothetical protein
MNNLIDGFDVALADPSTLAEMFNNRERYVSKKMIRVAVGTWNINGDKNPALEHEYRSILNAWMFDGPDYLSTKTMKQSAIPTIGEFYLTGTITDRHLHLTIVFFRIYE